MEKLNQTLPETAGQESQGLESKYQSLHRKHRRFVFGSIIFLSVALALLSMHLFYQLVIIPNENKLSNERIFSNEFYSSRIFVLGEATQGELDALERALVRIAINADGVLEYFYNAGGMVYFSQIPLRNLPHNQHLPLYPFHPPVLTRMLGQFISTPSVQIHIYNVSGDNMRYTVFREFGLFVDWHFGNISNSEDFQAIHAEERYLAFAFQEDVKEYFADAFMWYIANPITLRAITPLTYAFMDNLFGN